MPYNKLLTNLACSNRTGEYWPSVVFVRTSLRSVRTATTSGQYSPVRPSRSVSKRLVLGRFPLAGLAPVVQRADIFIHWISCFPEEQMYSNQCFWQVFHAIPFLNLTYSSTLFTNYRTIVKILHTFYLPDSELSSGSNYPPFEQLGLDRSVRKRNGQVILVLRISSKLRVQFSESLFFKILQHHPFKMTHLLYRVAGQFWQMKSRLSDHGEFAM